MRINPISGNFRGSMPAVDKFAGPHVADIWNPNPKLAKDYTKEIQIALTNIIYGGRKGIGEHTPEGYGAVAKLFNIKNFIKLGGESAVFCLNDGNILKISIELFKTNQEILQKYQEKFKYIMVDEYQDTNTAQYIWLRLLAMGYSNICCVGDDDQSIYSWRGADIENILKFDQDFKNATIIRLGQNYRSTKNIIKAASGLIENNSMRMKKNFWTEEEAGLPVIVKALMSPIEEARFIASLIESKHKNGLAFSDIAILVRATYQTRVFEERFLAEGIPYIVVGGLKFYERKEVKDAIAYLRLTLNPDDGIAFERIVNLPKRGIGTTSINKFYALARENSISLPKAASEVAKNLKSTSNTKLLKFFNQLDDWRRDIEVLSPADLMQKILNESGYISMLKESKNIEDEARLETLDELVK